MKDSIKMHKCVIIMCIQYVGKILKNGDTENIHCTIILFLFALIPPYL